MKKYLMMGLSLIFLCAITARTAEINYNEVGVGLGIPYGGIGVNYEFSPVDRFSLDAGAGWTPGGFGWSVGPRVYFADQSKSFRPRISASYGTVAIIKPQFGDWKTDTGCCVGPGFQWVFGQKKNWSLDFDVLYVFYNLPRNYRQEWGTDHVKVSIGFGYHF